MAITVSWQHLTLTQLFFSFLVQMPLLYCTCTLTHTQSLTLTHTHTSIPLTLTLTHSHRLCISICADLTFKEKAMLASVYGPWLIIPLTYVWKLAMDPQPYRKYKRD